MWYARYNKVFMEFILNILTVKLENFTPNPYKGVPFVNVSFTIRNAYICLRMKVYFSWCFIVYLILCLVFN